MSSQLVKSTARIFGGSAIAGMGFSFGQDIYKKAKSKEGQSIIVLLLVLIGSCLGLYTSGVWISRNYKSFWKALFHRTSAIIFFVPFFVVIMLLTGLIYTLVEGAPETQTTSNESTSVTTSDSTNDARNEDKQTAVNKATQSELIALFHFFGMHGGYIIGLGIFGSGLLVGFIQRHKRRLAWDAEESNELFMKNNGLVQHDNSIIEDMSTGQNYRIEYVGSTRVTLFPIGRRGKRAFINIDSEGKYMDFTGAITI